MWEALASENLSQAHVPPASADVLPGPGRPLGLSIGPAPFSRSVEVRFALGAAGATTVDILDVTGRLVRTFSLGVAAAGDHHITWNGRRTDGHDAGPGLYVFRVRQGSTALTAKAIRIP